MTLVPLGGRGGERRHIQERLATLARVAGALTERPRDRQAHDALRSLLPFLETPLPDRELDPIRAAALTVARAILSGAPDLAPELLAHARALQK